MSETDETLEIPKKDLILEAIENLSRKFDTFETRFNGFEKTTNIQFEVIREGIAYNSAAFDRLEAKFFDARSDIANLRADIKGLSEEIRQMKSVV